MTRDKLTAVLLEYERILRQEPRCADLYAYAGDSKEIFEHLSWMINEMRWTDDWEKQMRWLGFIQGVLWAQKVYPIDILRKHNRG